MAKLDLTLEGEIIAVHIVPEILISVNGVPKTVLASKVIKLTAKQWYELIDKLNDDGTHL